jgi:hypothetical protein
MNYLITKKINNFPKEIRDFIDDIAIGKRPYLVGSGSITSLLYNNDIDVNEKLQNKHIDLSKHIQFLKNQNDIWIVDIHQTKQYLQINTICNFNGMLLDINDTIFFSKEPSNREKSISLKKDIDNYIRDGNYIKAVKRLLSLLQLNQKKNILHIKILIDFLNSNIGLLQDIINQLIIIITYSKLDNIDKSLINSNLSYCQYHLNNIYCVPIESKLYSMFNMKDANKLINILSKKVQTYTKQWITLNKKYFNL